MYGALPLSRRLATSPKASSILFLKTNFHATASSLLAEKASMVRLCLPSRLRLSAAICVPTSSGSIPSLASLRGERLSSPSPPTPPRHLRRRCLSPPPPPLSLAHKPPCGWSSKIPLGKVYGFRGVKETRAGLLVQPSLPPLPLHMHLSRISARWISPGAQESLCPYSAPCRSYCTALP